MDKKKTILVLTPLLVIIVFMNLRKEIVQMQITSPNSKEVIVDDNTFTIEGEYPTGTSILVNGYKGVEDAENLFWQRGVNFKFTVLLRDSIKIIKIENVRNDSLLSQTEIRIVKKFTESELKKKAAYKKKRRAEDSLAVIKKEAKELAFLKTKAGNIWKKRPEWSREDCELLANGEFWIGMEYEMIKYMRGLPSSANPSNYGNGVQWQWCWLKYSPSCFYDNDGDGKIDS
jgi:hypothetical protein